MRWIVVLLIAAGIAGWVIRSRDRAPEPAPRAAAPEPPRPTAREVLAEHGFDAGGRFETPRAGAAANRGISGHLDRSIGGQLQESERRADRY